MSQTAWAESDVAVEFNEEVEFQASSDLSQPKNERRVEKEPEVSVKKAPVSSEDLMTRMGLVFVALLLVGVIWTFHSSVWSTIKASKASSDVMIGYMTSLAMGAVSLFLGAAFKVKEDSKVIKEPCSSALSSDWFFLFVLLTATIVPTGLALAGGSADSPVSLIFNGSALLLGACLGAFLISTEQRFSPLSQGNLVSRIANALDERSRRSAAKRAEKEKVAQQKKREASSASGGSETPAKKKKSGWFGGKKQK